MRSESTFIICQLSTEAAVWIRIKEGKMPPPPQLPGKEKNFHIFQVVDILSSGLECFLNFGRLCGGLIRITKN
jgi:hypothetical protein